MLLQDVRYALRSLWHSKGFATVAILCLGFGIGLNATIFSVMDGVLLKPYPYDDPDRILIVQTLNQKTENTAGLSYLDMRDLKAATTSFATIAATTNRSLAVAESGRDPERYVGAGISWDLFPMLGTSPILGHGFTADDDKEGAPGVVLLSHDLWMRRYNGDRDVLGKTVLVNAKPCEIIGVMPPRFQFPQNQRLWIPLTPLVAKDPRDFRGLFAFGRLKPGVSAATAKQDLDAIAARLATTYPATNEGWTADLRTLRERFLPPEVPVVIYLMMGGVTLVLFIACSNVANLLLARATARKREISVRTALGAGRGRIVRQLLTESVVLSLVSVPLGVLLAEFGTRAIASAMPPDQVPYYITWELDWRSLVYTIAIAAATAILFGLFPALQVSRGNLHESLKEGTRGNTASRSLMRSTFVVMQVAFAAVALVGAILFVRSFRNMGAADVGFDPKPLMAMRFYMPGAPYDAEDAKLRRVEDVVRRAEALPGVQAAFSSNLVPFSGGGGGGPITIEGRPSEPGRQPGITFIGVTPHFTQTLGIGPSVGRTFRDDEGWSHAHVAIVNTTMSKRFWPNGDAVGARFKVGAFSPEDPWFTVIGVIPDVNLFGIDPSNPQLPAIAFMPYAFQQSLNTGLTLRVAGDPPAITAAVREQLRASDPNLPMFQARTVDESRQLNYWAFGLYGWIFGTIGVMGLLLASIGVYGVLSYSVEQRSQEIGVRVALGAVRWDVLRLVIGHGVTLAVIGILAGLVLSGLSMFYGAKQFFYNVSPLDPVTFSAVSLFLVAVAFFASYLPARRAAKVDPIVALRGE